MSVKFFLAVLLLILPVCGTTAAVEPAEPDTTTIAVMDVNGDGMKLRARMEY